MSSDIAVELQEVSYRWRSADRILLDIDTLRVVRGEKLFIMGPSGSGKTTLLSLIGGVITPDRGRITVVDLEMSVLNARCRDAERANHIGMIFQMFNLIPYLSVVENTELPCQFSEKRRQRAISARGSVRDECLHLLSSLGLGEAALSARAAVELSVGQQQRVAVARALIGQPEIIIADEPTSSLDANARGEFLDLLFGQCNLNSTTLLFVSHDASLKPRFDRSLDLNAINAASED